MARVLSEKKANLAQAAVFKSSPNKITTIGITLLLSLFSGAKFRKHMLKNIKSLFEYLLVPFPK